MKSLRNQNTTAMEVQNGQLEKSSENHIALLMRSLANQEAISIAVAERNLSVELASKGKNLQSIVKSHGMELPLSALSGIILLTTEFFAGSGTQMSPTQSIQTAALLLESYPAETIEDVMLCFKNAKQGKYGKIYNRIDGQIIFEWFRQYLDEKYEYLEQKRHQEKYEINDRNNETLGMLSSLIEPIIIKAKLDNQPPPLKSRQLDEKSEIETIQNNLHILPTNQLKSLLHDYETKSKGNFWSHYENQRDIIRKEIERRTREEAGSGAGKVDAGEVS